MTLSESDSPEILRQQAMRSGNAALILIAFVLTLSAVFFAVGISRSAESSYIFELVNRQLSQAKNIETLIVKMHTAKDLQQAKELLTLGIEKAKSIESQIKMPNRWGPMDAKEVDIFNQAYTHAPLYVDQHFQAMINKAEALAQVNNDSPASMLESARQANIEFQRRQAKMINLYLERIDTVLDHSRIRITSTFVVLFISLILFRLYLLRPFANRLYKQAKNIQQVTLKLQDAANKDFLTNLPNRLYVNHTLKKMMEQSLAHDKPLAIAHIDLDKFKETNDTYGHAAGDFLLVKLAERISKLLSSAEIPARVGGDEFILLLPNAENLWALEDKLKLFLRELARPLDFEGITLRSSASIGVSVFPKDGTTQTELMTHADLALYEVKKNHRGGIIFYKEIFGQKYSQLKSLENDLYSGLKNKQVEPYFQPQLDVLRQKVIGFECLVRWQHPTRGFIPPNEFLPVAASSGLMPRLGRYIMERAIAEAAKWYKEGSNFGRLSLNASAQELLEDDFSKWILKTASTHGLPSNKLSIELLETVIMKDNNLKLSDKLALLRTEKVHIELDDFGTGYASLQQIKPEEVDRLKIDRAFIKNINNNPINATIVKAMVDIAYSLDINIIAEGVETDEEIASLRQLGCFAIQGYGIAKPMPFDESYRWLKAFQNKVQDQ